MAPSMSKLRRKTWSGPRATKAGLKRMEEWAESWLARHEEAPTEVEVARMFDLLGERWPTQSRPNVTATGDPVPGMCLGLVFAMGSGPQVSYISECCPAVNTVVTKWVESSLPRTRDGDTMPFSSIQINKNYAAIEHVDGNNIGPSFIIALGNFVGGCLKTVDGLIDCHRRWRLFDGNKPHSTQAFKGDRMSFIVFSSTHYRSLQPRVVTHLKQLGFTAARSDGKDLAFFQGFRIEKSYLSEEHNASFRKCLKDRQKQNAPRKSLVEAGDVAVECYGRQAERGGGWMALKPDACTHPVVLELQPNTVGIWLAVLEFDASGRLLVKQHVRLNFYADLEKTTKKFTQLIDGLPDGTPVLMGIADTAAAKTRPLKKAFYAQLHRLGASLDMPAVEYRVAWALIGFKGAPPGSAVHAVGTRSTLLRLDANFSKSSDGSTLLTLKRQPDLTSIVDVVTGGGQDCALDNAPPLPPRDEQPREPPPGQDAGGGAAAASHADDTSSTAEQPPRAAKKPRLRPARLASSS